MTTFIASNPRMRGPDVELEIPIALRVVLRKDKFVYFYKFENGKIIQIRSSKILYRFGAIVDVDVCTGPSDQYSRHTCFSNKGQDGLLSKHHKTIRMYEIREIRS